MEYLNTYKDFSTNETLDMFTLPVDPIPGMKDVISDISQWISDTGEFIWDKITSFIDWIKNKLSKFKDYFAQLFEAIGEMSKIQLNRITNLLFSKDYSDLEWSDLSAKSVKNLYSKISVGLKDFVTDKSWSFSDDKEKLKSEDGLEDKSLKLKFGINKILALAGKSAISLVLSNLITSALVALGVTAGPIITAVCSIVILIVFIWASKKKVNLEIKVMKDVRDVPGYKPKSFISKITGWDEFTKSKVKDYQDFTQGESPFQKMYLQKLKEQGQKIRQEDLSFN
jgi:hypothetical protein